MAARKPKPKSRGLILSTRYKGIPIRLDMRDLTVARLLQLKAWFGEPYSIPVELIRLIALNEAAAMMSAVWIGLQIAGKPIADARDLDFNFEEDFEALEDIEPPEDEQDPPTSDVEGTPTPD